MKNLFILLFILATHNLWAVCSAPVSRTAVGTNSVLTSTKYNLDLNTIYNRANNLPGDCVLDDSLNGSKLIDATVSAAKLASNSVTTGKIADGSVTAAKLAAAIDNLVPIGTILPYGGATAPSGYLICNGQSVSRAVYANLYGVLGNSFGTADGVSFNVPDLRGRFLRMVDGGAGNDPDRASRTAIMTGAATGDNIGSLQNYQVQSHNHYEGTIWFSTSNFNRYGGSNLGNTNSLQGTSSGTVNNSLNALTSSTGGSETRPVNVNVNYIIKY